MKRNLNKAIEQGHKIIRQNQHFDLLLSELDELIEISYQKEKNRINLYRIISCSFMTGVAIGFRISKKKK